VGVDSAERGRSRLGPDGAARKRAAVETYARHEAALRRVAQRHSLCADDAEDALQRGLEILLRKAPTEDPRELVKWTQTVVRHEALAVRRERERFLPDPAAVEPEPDGEDWVALLPALADGPAERVERREALGRTREALRALKPQELRALTMLAAGYSYAEIGEINDWSQTKVNRCLAEGRKRFRALIAGGEDGSRCAELGPLLSAFCDGEATAAEVAVLREHLRACASCRATLRTYRAAPAAAAALAPAIPLPRSLWEKVHDGFAEVAARFGGRGEAATQVAGGGAGGTGIAALAKVAAVCVATAGGAAVCVATGVLPAPPGLAGDRQPQRALERRLAETPAPAASTPKVEPAPAPVPEPKPEREPKPGRQPAPAPEEAPAESEPVPVTEEPAAEEAIEPAPAPSPEPIVEPAPVTSSSSGSPAGEFGP
jgi:RNA polymerase sigma factor (sigma-70 family)